MTCPAAITRAYEARAPVWESRAARGLQPTLEGWRIGRVGCDDPSSRVEVGLPDRGGNLDSPGWRECLPEEALRDTLSHCKLSQNPTGASLPRIRRDVARAWRLMLSLNIDEALRAIGQLELQLAVMSPTTARRFRCAAQLLRAAGLAFQDDSLAVLAIAIPHLNLKASGATQDSHAALTLCRLGFWHVGELDSFYSLPRPETVRAAFEVIGNVRDA